MRRYLVCILVVLACIYSTCPSVSAADALPPEWNQNATPQKLLETSDTILNNLKYYYGFKNERRSDPSRSLELLHRKRADGVVEKKVISRKRESGRWVATYVSTEGKWLEADNLKPAKIEYEEGEELEKRFAAGIANPYSYSMLEPETKGSNSFLVISRKMSPQLFQAIYDDMMKGKSPEDIKTMFRYGIALEDQIGYKSVYYIRKSDGISYGRLIKNKNGAIINDEMFDDVDIHKAISDDDIGFNKLTHATVFKSASDFRKSVVKETIKIAESREASKKSRRTYSIFGTSLLIFSLLGMFYHFRRKQVISVKNI